MLSNRLTRMTSNMQPSPEILALGWPYLAVTMGLFDTVGGKWRVEKVKMKQKELENLSEEMEQENE